MPVVTFHRLCFVAQSLVIDSSILLTNCFISPGSSKMVCGVKVGSTVNGIKRRFAATVNGCSNSTSSPDLHADSSVAKRRAVRKCRQLSSSIDGSSVNHVSKRTPTLRAHLGPERDQAELRQLRRVSNARVKQAVAQAVRSPKRRVSEKPRPSETKIHLDMLHTETLAQTGKMSTVSYGCNDPCMSSFTCHYQPQELHSLDETKTHDLTTSDARNLGHSEQVVPLALTQYLGKLFSTLDPRRILTGILVVYLRKLLGH